MGCVINMVKAEHQCSRSMEESIKESVCAENILIVTWKETLPRRAQPDSPHTKDGSIDWKGRPSHRATTGGWRAASFIIGQQFWGMLCYNGVGKTITRYLTTVMHQGNVSASNFANIWSGTAYVTPLLGALLADSYWGRFKTSVIFSVIYLLGAAVVTLSGTISSLIPPQCPAKDYRCQPSTSNQRTLFYVGLYIVALGSGGAYSTYSTLGAGQFDDEEANEKKQKSSFFNWFYQALTCGYLISATFLVFIQEHQGWGIGYLIATIACFFSLLCLLGGIPFYRHQKPAGNALSRVAQVFVASCRNWKLPSPLNRTELFEISDAEHNAKGVSVSDRRLVHTKSFLFLDKAAIGICGETTENTKGSPWKLCTVTHVEEVKCLLRLLPICASSIIFTTVYAQLSTLFVLQGATMRRQLGPLTISPVSLTVFEGLSVVICGILYARALVPIARRFTGHPAGITPLQRVAIGLSLSIGAMVTATVVETKRLRVVHEYGLQDSPSTPLPMSVFYLVPQYFLVGACEVFVYIGIMEFFYDHCPESFRSVGNAISLCTNALGNYLSGLLVNLVRYFTTHNTNLGWIPDNLNRGKVDRFYYLMTILCTLNFIYFIVTCLRYREISVLCENWPRKLQQCEATTNSAPPPSHSTPTNLQRKA